MSDDFQSLLSKPIDEFEAPVPLPVGSYVATISKFTFGKSKERQTDYVEFELIPMETLPDVDTDKLADSLNGEPLQSKVQKTTFYLTAGAMFRLKEFLKDGVGIEEGLTTAEAIQAAVNQQVVFVIEHKPNTRDPSKVFANIVKFGKVPGADD